MCSWRNYLIKSFPWDAKKAKRITDGWLPWKTQRALLCRTWECEVSGVETRFKQVTHSINRNSSKSKVWTRSLISKDRCLAPQNLQKKCFFSASSPLLHSPWLILVVGATSEVLDSVRGNSVITLGFCVLQSLPCWHLLCFGTPKYGHLSFCK